MDDPPILPGLSARQAAGLRARGIRTRRQLLAVVDELPAAARAYLTHQPKMCVPLAEADDVVKKVIGSLRFNGRTLSARQALAVGSIRRRKPRIKDLDVLIIAPREWRDVLANLRVGNSAVRVLDSYTSGDRRRSLIVRTAGGKYKVDLFLARHSERAFALYHHTGSRRYNIRIRAHAKSRGWKLNQYGLFSARTGKPVAGSGSVRTEEQLAALLGVTYRRPVDRTV